MRGMAWAQRPARVDERILDVLLDVGDELLAARGDTERLHIRGRIPNDGGITSAERADDVLLETGNELSQSERVCRHEPQY